MALNHRCPECLSPQLRIRALFEADYDETPSEINITNPDDECYDYDDNSITLCKRCDYEATLKDFAHQSPEPLTVEQYTALPPAAQEALRQLLPSKAEDLMRCATYLSPGLIKQLQATP